MTWTFGSAFFATLLLSLARFDNVPTFVPGFFALLMAFVVWRPAGGLLLLAGAIPIATWIGRRWNPLVAWPEALVVTFLAGYCLHAAVRTRRAADRFTVPLLLMSIVVVASLAVQLTTLHWRVGPAVFRADLLNLIGTDYFLVTGSADAIDAAMRLLESLLLFRAATSVSQVLPGFLPRLAGCFVAGAAAAGTLNLWRLWEAAQRAEAPVAAFLGYISSIRLNVHYGDLNAAGSYFILALFVAMGLVLRSKRRLWAAAAVPIVAAAWVAGSRAAFGGAVVAALLPFGALTQRIQPRIGTRVWAGAALLACLIALSAAYFLPGRGDQARFTTALFVRWELAQTSGRMWAARPAFGLELGEYYRRSGEFSSPELLRIFPPAHNENAHNNFLQILAELGTAGFAAFAWLLGLSAAACARLLRADPYDPLRWALVTGLLAFVLTWLGGHPLLIDEPAFSFWILLGAASGRGLGPPAPDLRTRRRAWLTAAAIVALVASIPARAERQMAEADLDHVGIGLSAWQDELDGVRYRIAARTSTVFLPAHARSVTIPLRGIDAGEELRVELRLDGRSADVVRVPADRWLALRLALPASREGPRFRRLDLIVNERPSTDPALLMIGKVEPH